MSKEMERYRKALPIPDEDSTPYWQATRRHELNMQRCSACDQVRFPPQVLCPGCWSDQYTWQRLSGRGTVYTHGIVRHAFHPQWADDVPYIVALVELDEGVKLFTNIVDCAPEQLRIGQPVEVVFADVNEELSLPKFRPVG